MSISISSIIKQLIKQPQHQPIDRSTQLQIPITNGNLFELLKINPQKRTKKVTKLIKSELKYLQVFQYQNNHIDQLTKKEDELFLNILSYLIEYRVYRKGTLIQITGKQRDSIRILYLGNIIVYQPINHRSYKESLNRVKQNYYSDTSVLINMENSSNGQNYDYLELLAERNVISKSINPHRQSKTIQPGNLICHNNWVDKLKQLQQDSYQTKLLLPQEYQCCCVCNSNCIIFEISLQTLKKLIQILPNHTGLDPKLRPYIQSLLKTLGNLPGFKYSHILQHVSNNNLIQCHSKLDLKSENCVYHIVEGQATIQIVDHKIKKNLLILYQSDFFGFQDKLFPNQIFNYIIEPRSKILKIEIKRFQNHIYSIPALGRYVLNMQNIRKQILGKLIRGIERPKKKLNKKSQIKQFSSALSNYTKYQMSTTQFQSTFNKQKQRNSETILLKLEQNQELKNNIKDVTQNITFINRFIVKDTSQFKIDSNQVSIFNQKGRLIRKINIVEGQTDKQIYRKMGLIDIQDIVSMNKKIQKLQNPEDKRIQQFSLLTQKQKNLLRKKKINLSLPKLQYFAKKQDRIYRMKLYQ